VDYVRPQIVFYFKIYANNIMLIEHYSKSFYE